MKTKQTEKTVLVGFKATPEERLEIKKRAYSRLQTVSEYLRDKAL